MTGERVALLCNAELGMLNKLSEQKWENEADNDGKQMKLFRLIINTIRAETIELIARYGS